MKYTMGIDIGTTAIKVGLLNLTTLTLEGLVSTSLSSPLDLPSDLLWEQTKLTIAKAVQHLGSNGTIAAIGVSGQMHGAVLYDHQGAVLDPIITWMDRLRCSPDVLHTIQTTIDRGDYHVGTHMACGYTGAILLWLKQHDPALYTNVAKFTLIPDFIRARLLGVNDFSTDPTNAFGTGLFNVSQKTNWHTDLIQALDLDIGMFPGVLSSVAVAGVLSKSLAVELGLEQIPIIYGGGDNQVGMVGSGLTSSNSPCLLNIGTAAQISQITSTCQFLPGMDTRSFFENQFAFVGASLSGGGSYQWLQRSIQEQVGQYYTYKQLDQLASEVPPGSNGLEFCTGPTRQSPHRERGFIGNLAYVSDIGHRARAVLEGVLMDLYEYYAVLKKYDHSPYLIGGGKGLQVSDLWPQIAADLFNKPIQTSKKENVVLGASFLAAYGTGYVSGLDGLAPVEDALKIYPNPARAAYYANKLGH